MTRRLALEFALETVAEVCVNHFRLRSHDRTNVATGQGGRNALHTT